jgi:1-deoxy-D-xylulose-5-phosphate reductoisomerase
VTHGVAILGATGSIGKSALDVIARHPDRYRVVALTAHANVEALIGLCARFRPDLAVIADPARERALRAGLAAAGLKTQGLAGADALSAAATAPGTDTVVAAIVGAAGLVSTLAAARAGRRILLANKEAIVCAGSLLMDAVRAGDGQLLPLDSEHSAIHQCLAGAGAERGGVRRLILTASGGPFRTRTELGDVTPEQACAHPNWSMGRKISVDSATLMNKGLEVIEANWLFGFKPAQIDVVVHPQSVIHSMVEFVDGSVLAQLGTPDMRTPLAYALGFPERLASGSDTLDFLQLGALTFEAPDRARFPCLRLAYEALSAGPSACIWLNAANEVAVAAFLAGRIPFLDIARIIEQTVGHAPLSAPRSVDEVLQGDASARRRATALIDRSV